MKIVKIPKREEGQGLVEYALVLVLVAIVVIIILTQIGSLIVLAFATIIGTFTGQQLTGTGNEGIVVSGGSGQDIGGDCQLQGPISVVLVQNGNVVTDSTESVNFSFGNGVGASNISVTIEGSGVGTATLPQLLNDCPVNLKVTSW